NPGHLGAHASNDLFDLGANLFDSAEPLATNPSNLFSADPDLQPIADNGGAARTMALGPDSDAIDAGYGLFSIQNDPALMDARGFVRNLLSPTGRVDIGAYETGSQDTDGDLMPDDWELANALNPGDPNDAGLDNDWDGLTNLEEFQNGSLPWDNYSKNGDFAPHPEFVSDGNTWSLQWDSASLTPPTQRQIFFDYQIYTSIDLEDWREFGPLLPGEAMTFLREILFDGPERFWRIGYRVDLAGEDLRGEDLSNADLSGADLSGADLSGADLSGACLQGADLTGADLSGSDLAGAELGGALGVAIAAFPGGANAPVATSLPAFAPQLYAADFSEDPGRSHSTVA
ncbi:MAG: pentapeptide repeat-containing protein, partial [Verrucomicrobiales bacterium]